MLHHVTAQHIAIAASIGLQLIDCAVGSVTYPVGIAVRMEASVKQRLDQIAQRMMHDSVTERSSTDLPALGFVDIEVDVVAGVIGSVG